MLPTRGRPGAALMMTVARELSAQDLIHAAMKQNTSVISPPIIQKLRTSHHEAARYLANGKTIHETAFLVGRTPERIAQLARDPAFQELMAYYMNQRSEVMYESTARMAAELIEIAEMSKNEIISRLEDDKIRASIPMGELRLLMGDTLDRTIAPKKSAQPTTQVPAQITFNIGNRDIRPKIIDNEDEAVVDIAATSDE